MCKTSRRKTLKHSLKDRSHLEQMERQPFFLLRVALHYKDTSSPTLIYKFNAVLKNIPKLVSVELDKLIIKFTWKSKHARIINGGPFL